MSIQAKTVALRVALAVTLLSVNNEAFSYPAAGLSGKVYQSMAAVGHPPINLWLLLLGAVAIGSILCFMAFRPEKRQHHSSSHSY